MDYAVELQDVTKSYGGKRVLRSLSLAVPANTLTVILGSPGSGKSVIVRVLTGLEKPDSGRVLLRGVDAGRVSPAARNIGYVPQSFALYPHYSVFDNIGYPLKLMGLSRGEIEPVVRQASERLKIEDLLSKKPDQLSGGEKQRVAIARGIVKDTDIFVLDDPLTGLDFKLREQLFDDLARMQDDLGATFIYTTSDPLETLMLAELVLIFDQGQIVEHGDLNEIYKTPANLRTMALLGFPEANVFAGSLNGDAVCHNPLFAFEVSLDQTVSASEVISVAVRPRDVLINPPANAGLLTSPAHIGLVEDLGGELVVYLEAQGVELTSVVRHDEIENLSEGPATVGIAPDRIFLYRHSDGIRIGQGKP